MAIPFLQEEENPQNEASPSMSEVLQQAISSQLYEMKVAMPAEVIKYDKDKQKVDVQPLLKKKYNDGSLQDQPKVYNVPVVFPRAGDAFISMPIKAGHNVLLIFIDRSIDKWLSNGGKLDPEDTRKHSISDAVALPGLYPFNNTVKINNADDIIIKNTKDSGKTEIRVKNNGHLQVINQTTELIKTLDEWMSAMREAVVYTSTGAQQLRHAKFSSIQTKLKTFLEK